MKRSNAELRGVSGNTPVCPDQGGEAEQTPQAAGPIHQSCPDDSNASTKLRIRLSRDQAKRWMALPPKLRQRVTRVVFGAVMHGVDLDKLASTESELRLARLEVNNLLQLALLKGAALDTGRAHTALDRINRLLGGKKP